MMQSAEAEKVTLPRILERNGNLRIVPFFQNVLRMKESLTEVPSSLTDPPGNQVAPLSLEYSREAVTAVDAAHANFCTRISSELVLLGSVVSGMEYAPAATTDRALVNTAATRPATPDRRHRHTWWNVERGQWS
jgi:hypothetical protein